jgi:outer membrane protein insertion porin family
VRGYRAYSLGPLDANANALGGNRKVVGSAELLFPVPGAEKDKSLRLGWFFDAGQIYGDGERLAPSDLRYSTGLSFAWNSPFGPLRVSLAFPLHARDGIDHTQRLQFNFGTNF